MWTSVKPPGIWESIFKNLKLFLELWFKSWCIATDTSANFYADDIQLYLLKQSLMI